MLSSNDAGSRPSDVFGCRERHANGADAIVLIASFQSLPFSGFASFLCRWRQVSSSRVLISLLSLLSSHFIHSTMNGVLHFTTCFSYIVALAVCVTRSELFSDISSPHCFFCLHSFLLFGHFVFSCASFIPYFPSLFHFSFHF